MFGSHRLMLRVVGAVLIAAAIAGMVAATGGQARAAGSFCTEVIVPSSVPANSPVSAVLALIQGNFTTTSVFRYNNTRHAFDALYFSAPAAPVDATTVGPGQPLFICGSGSGSFPHDGF